MIADYGSDPRIARAEIRLACEPAKIEVLEARFALREEAISVFCMTVGRHCHVASELFSLAYSDNNLETLHNVAARRADEAQVHYYGLPRRADIVEPDRLVWLTSSAVELVKEKNAWIVRLVNGADWRQEAMYAVSYAVSGVVDKYFVDDIWWREVVSPHYFENW